jgi:hypothetical protein
MSTSAIKVEPLVVEVSCTADALRAVLADGREVSVPLAWFPRLRDATPAQRSNWRLIGGGVGVHWPDLDEDISAESLLATR